ncbi:uncharacterized protein LOC117649737 [Thrips palmi]|uniref:Uncharacterized protein LOC117649737 n=1 Tax=Thrips palmi TaxID=161013 RepID=A0A6P8ZTQ0_THRPL|nr:uncharacterized protein LOC117649737 [Thrips palmi]
MFTYEDLVAALASWFRSHTGPGGVFSDEVTSTTTPWLEGHLRLTLGGVADEGLHPLLDRLDADGQWLASLQAWLHINRHLLANLSPLVAFATWAGYRLDELSLPGAGLDVGGNPPGPSLRPSAPAAQEQPSCSSWCPCGCAGFEPLKRCSSSDSGPQTPVQRPQGAPSSQTPSPPP